MGEPAKCLESLSGHFVSVTHTRAATSIQRFHQNPKALKTLEKLETVIYLMYFGMYH